jgi:aminoglycoside phosphotransferase (APT) family kinase protein
MTLDVESLRAFLAAEVLPEWPSVRVGPVDRATGGLSWETFVVEATDGEARHERLVVKRAPTNGPLAPYDVRREVVVQQALASRGVPVADVLAHTTDPDVLGAPFSVMRFVEGDIPGLRTIERWPLWVDAGARARVGVELVDVLAAVQRVDWRSAGLADVIGGSGGAAARVAEVVDRLMGRIDRSVTHRWCASPVCREAGHWLVEHAGDLTEEGLVLVHGDYRIGNLVWRGDRIVAVLDWERVAVGDPMQDLGFFCMPMARARHPELMGMVMPLRDLQAAYRRATGRDLDDERLHYYVIFWQFVELAQITRAIPFLLDESPLGDVRSLTSYPLLSSGASQLLAAIEDHEAGRFGL